MWFSKVQWIQSGDHMTHCLFLSAVTLLVVNAASANVTYTTHDSNGNPIAVFTQVQGPGSFGTAWKDPSGTIWSSNQGYFTNKALKPDQDGVVMDSPATEACAKIGGSLPLLQDYRILAAYFEVDNHQNFTTQGLKDLNTLFPDMQNRSFWSSSLYPNVPDSAWLFYGDSGGSGYVGARDYYYDVSVRCVGR
jgi:hypothetical protein